MTKQGLVVVVVLALAAASCSDVSEPMTVDEYAAAMQAVESTFDSGPPDPANRPEDRKAYPLGGDLVAANDLYRKFQDRLVGWRAITPPASLSEAHARLVAALEAIQEEVGDYLGDQAMTGTDFHFETIGPAVDPFLREAAAACRQLRSDLHGAGVDVEFAGNCGF